jgi:hypothetical protein
LYNINVSVLSETYLKNPMRNFLFQIITYRTDRFPRRKGETTVTVRKGIPHKHVDLPPLVSIEATGVCIPIDSSEVLLAAVYKSPGHAWNDALIAELISFRHKSLLAGSLNAKHPLWNNVVSNPSGAKLLNLLHINVPLITPLQEIMTCSILLCTRLANCQK